MSTCPCCGSPLASEADIGPTLMLSKLERRIFDRLSSAFGTWVQSSALVHACYWDDPDGGPDNATRAVSATVRQLRKKVRAVGMAVDWSEGRGGGERRLIWQATTSVSPTINIMPGNQPARGTTWLRNN